MIASLLLAAAITLPPSAEAVRIGADQWPSAQIGPLGEGERLWWWSESCAPQLLKPGESPQCTKVAAKKITVVDEQGRPIEGVRVLWAFSDDVPDAMLPS